MSKCKIQSDDPSGRTKIPRIQPPRFQNPQYEEPGAGDGLLCNDAVYLIQTPADTISTCPGFSPSPFQGVVQSSWSCENHAPGRPRLGSGSSPAVALNSYSSSGATHGHSTSSSRYPPVDLQPQYAQQPGDLSRSETHNVHNATFQKGSFAHAHDFKIDTINIFGYEGQTEDAGSGEEARRNLEMSRTESEKRSEEKEVLNKIVLKALPGAMLDSEDRGYIPQCDEQTRLTIRNRIVEWARDHTLPPASLLFWLSGPAAVGKSAVAQTVAETMKQMGLLGAVFFFSRPNGRSDPKAVIPTLVLQLFTSIPEYRRIVSDKIARDPTILQKNRDTQFQELIIDPFLTLADSQAASNAQNILIVLDGLDECSDRAAQSEFVTIISRQVRSASRLRFLICSRPEPHLEVAFCNEEAQVITIRETLKVDDSEARTDADRLLTKGFTKIRSRYPDQLTDNWPTRTQIGLIADRASGHLGFVSFILRFIGDENYDDPSSQLEVCIRFLKRSRGSEASNPLHLLDLLYTQILSDIPSAVLPTTQRILAFSMFYSDMMDQRWSLYTQANFLGLSQASTYSALRRLHSVIAIPSPTEAAWSDLKVHHTSFTDYLKDPARSGKFALDKNTLPPMLMITRSMKWLDRTRGTLERFWSPNTREQLLSYLRWKLPFTDDGSIFHTLTKFSLLCLCRICPSVSEQSLQGLVSTLERFDFDLDYTRYPDEELRDSKFPNFIRWLVTLGALSSSFVEVIPPNACTMSAPHTTLVAWTRNPETYVAPFRHFKTEGNGFTAYVELGSVNPILLKLSAEALPGLVVILFTTALMSKRKADDDLHGRTKVARTQHSSPRTTPPPGRSESIGQNQAPDHPRISDDSQAKAPDHHSCMDFRISINTHPLLDFLANTNGHKPSRSPSPTTPPQPLHLIHAQNPTRSENHSLGNHGGNFAHARDFIANINMVEYNQTERAEDREVRDKLESKALLSATLDSVDRGYIPRCDEETRLTIRDRIVEWVQNCVQPRRLFWLSGPAAVGKSAVAQTVAETMKKMGLLVAVFFFSRPNNRSDPKPVIPTLVLQLFTSLPEYRRIVTDKLIQDPTILQKNLNIQFQELIIDPFLILANSQTASKTQDALLIVLDGLDECSGQGAQSNFIEMISRHCARSTSRLRFLICSRPEPCLKVAFSKEETKAITIQERLIIEDEEAQSDAYLLLRKGFAEIRSRYPDQLTDDWPTLAQIRLISDRASGHLGFASFIIRFIGDEDYDNPSGQLKVCMRFLEDSRGSEDPNPLHLLDLLYTRILSDIPSDILPTTQRILAFFMFYSDMMDGPQSLWSQSTFLGLSQADTYSALRRLHSVIVVPSPSEAGSSSLKVHHASFTDYLKDSARSGKFALDKDTLSPISTITLSIEWLDCTREILHRGPWSPAVWEALSPYLAWKLPSIPDGNILYDLTNYSFLLLWRIYPVASENSLKDFMNTSERFSQLHGDYIGLLLSVIPHGLLDPRNCSDIPRCDEQTRLTIRNRIVRWSLHTRTRYLFWLSGPASVGKSAVALTVKETMKEMGHPGAAFFFSRPNGRSNPNIVIPTLALQLFTSIPGFQHILTEKIARDPTILQKSRDVQFQELIIDPFLVLANSQSASNEQRILIVLDGLDECSDRAAQSEFLTTISRHAKSESRLRFLICSRHEPHLQVAFSKAETQAITIQDRLNVDDTEAQSDADRLLQNGFSEIRSRYPDQLTDDWPTPAQTRLIADRASGHLGVASSIIQFIGDKDCDDPSGQLEACIRFLECSRGSESSNPLRVLDLLYTQILTDIPLAILGTTQRLLAFFMFHSDTTSGQMSLFAAAAFLGLSQPSTYSALRRLHSVIAVPSHAEAARSNIKVHHASFTDYLKDPVRSGKFALDENTLPPMLMISRSIEWLNNTRGILQGGIWSRDTSKALLPKLPWKPPSTDKGLSLIQTIQ
ncbi:hypothetical protein NP233_g12096 [Leucocoprinus birnbaumii]|uniref:Nephrocystin 3-like N-terminal domain-containing protein n=1 Tax=Leucocoprinus birnbaumii TaxID=56174 RepID=A0AAD5VF71_9AGAR|nr:hypothetical protein NP233_g12096 [Leucocoprinus birnbaumii]